MGGDWRVLSKRLLSSDLMLKGSLPELCGEEAGGNPGRKLGDPLEGCCNHAGRDYRGSGQGGPGGGGEILVIVFRWSPQDLLVDEIRSTRGREAAGKTPGSLA